MNEEKENNSFNYFKFLIKIILFVISIYYIYKYRELIRRYISIINRWIRFSSPLRNINSRFRNWRERGLREQRQPLLDQIDREFQENLQRGNLEQDNLQRGAIAAAAASNFIRNRTGETVEGLESNTETMGVLPRRSGRVANWTGPINERIYKERREATLRANEVDLERKRADRAAVLEKTGGTTIAYLKNWITQQGYKQPEIQDLQSYWDLVLGRVEPISIDQPRQPSFRGEPSGIPFQDIETLDDMYSRRLSPSSMLYQQVPPNYLDQQFKPVDFGRRNNRRKNNRR
jgi:hypothetical protein